MARVCPNCGRELKDGVKFCPYCGTKVPLEEAPKEEAPKDPIENEDEIDEDIDESLDASTDPDISKQEEPAKKEEPTPKQEPVKKEEPKSQEKTQSKVNKIINMIVAGFCLLTALFFFIGVFGPVFRVSTDSQFRSFGMNYFFKDGPESLRNIRDAGYQKGTYYSFMLSTFVMEAVLYFGGMAGCLALTIVGLVKNIKALVKKSEPNINLLMGAGMLRLLAMFMFYAEYSVSGSGIGNYISSSFGWGGGLIIAGLSVLLFCQVSRSIAGAIITKNNLVGNIVKSVVAIVLFILVFNVFGPLTMVVQNNGYYTIRMRLNGVNYVPSVLASYSMSSDATLNSGVFYPGIISFAFTFAGLIMLFNAYKKTFEDSKAGPIVLSALAFFFLILAASLSLSAIVEYIGTASNIVYTFASGPIAGMVVILVLVIPGLVVSAIFNKKKEQ